MALHKDFPQSPYAILDPDIRWFPADEALRETSMEKLMPPLVSQLRKRVKEFRDSGYVGTTDTSKSLLNWWFNTPYVLDEARAKGIDIAPKYIPAEVFDKRAVEKNQVVFHDVAAVEVKPHVKNNSVAVELTDFSVFYSQDTIANAEATLKNKGSKIVVDCRQIVKVSKDKGGIVTREVLTKTWTDWIDYWAVDFNFESKREIIRVPVNSPEPSPPTPLSESEGRFEEVWTGDYIFENEWQSFRTKKDRSLELKSVFHECAPGRRKIAVKVVDIFGTDTMSIIEITVEGK